MILEEGGKFMWRKYSFIIMMFCMVCLLVACSGDDHKSELEQTNAANLQIGNSPANHANGGRVCGFEGGIYFSDCDEGGYLYKSLPDGTDKELVLSESCYNINIIGDFLYYQSEKDHSIRAYCIVNGESKILVEDAVEDMVVTSDAIYFISDTIEQIDLTGENRICLMPEGEYFYLDVYGDFLFYTLDEISLYALNIKTKSTQRLLEEAKGAVVIDNKIFYTGKEDNNLYCYDRENKAKDTIGIGYNANVWKDNIYYIKENHIYCHNNGIDNIVLEDYFGQIIKDYKLEEYYIVNSYMYIIYSVPVDGIDYKEMLAFNLESM